MMEVKGEGGESKGDPGVGMGIDKILTIPIRFSILLIDPIPYRFPYRFSLGKRKGKRTNGVTDLTLTVFYSLNRHNWQCTTAYTVQPGKFK